MNRVVGLETEYGCLCEDPLGPASVVAAVRDWVFRGNRFGLPDVVQRDWDEPAGNGGFLFNGGRLYVDLGHLEYCTPECRSLRDLIRYDRAGDRLLHRALDELALSPGTGFVRNNVDHYSGATFGCHENYLVRRTASWSDLNLPSLLAFLSLRLLYTGAGRVGASLGARNRGDLDLPGADRFFQISQRADYINNELFEWVQFNRAIINTRDEPLADPARFRRLHLLHGDTNVLPATQALKIGTTALVLDLLELDRLPPFALDDAVAAFRRLSHRTTPPWPVDLASGRTVDARELLRRYLDAARAEFAGRDPETDAVLELWAGTLDSLERDPGELVGRVDWITKHWLLDQFRIQEGLAWDDPWLRSQDLEYHHLDPERGLGWALDRGPEVWQPASADLDAALLEPPVDTRAHARSRIMRDHVSPDRRYFIDWEMLHLEGIGTVSLPDPLDPAPPPLPSASLGA